MKQISYWIGHYQDKRLTVAPGGYSVLTVVGGASEAEVKEKLLYLVMNWNNRMIVDQTAHLEENEISFGQEVEVEIDNSGWKGLTIVANPARVQELRMSQRMGNSSDGGVIGFAFIMESSVPVSD